MGMKIYAIACCYTVSLHSRLFSHMINTLLVRIRQNLYTNEDLNYKSSREKEQTETVIAILSLSRLRQKVKLRFLTRLETSISVPAYVFFLSAGLQYKLETDSPPLQKHTDSLRTGRRCLDGWTVPWSLPLAESRCGPPTTNLAASSWWQLSFLSHPTNTNARIPMHIEHFIHIQIRKSNNESN